MNSISGNEVGGERLTEAVTYKVPKTLKMLLVLEGLTGEEGAELVRKYLLRLALRRQKRRVSRG
jgi:hypothetical protein